MIHRARLEGFLSNGLAALNNFLQPSQNSTLTAHFKLCSVSAGGACQKFVFRSAWDPTSQYLNIARYK
jgi:hypothetical protein